MRRLPSPSMAVALLALFVAVGGTAYAVKTIDGKLLKNRSVAGKKLKRNTLGGKQIAEGRLGRVPRAASADSASFAQTAGSAQTAANATTAAKATTADNASALSGLSLGELVRGSTSPAGSCDPDDADLFAFACRSVTISNPRVGTILVLATGTWFGADQARGTCTLRRGADGMGASSQQTELGQDEPVHVSEVSGAAFSLAGIFGSVPAGDQGFAVVCTENTAPNIQFANVRVTAVRLTQGPTLVALP